MSGKLICGELSSYNSLSDHHIKLFTKSLSQMKISIVYSRCISPLNFCKTQDKRHHTLCAILTKKEKYRWLRIYHKIECSSFLLVDINLYEWLKPIYKLFCCVFLQDCSSFPCRRFSCSLLSFKQDESILVSVNMSVSRQILSRLQVNIFDTSYIYIYIYITSSATTLLSYITIQTYTAGQHKAL